MGMPGNAPAAATKTHTITITTNEPIASATLDLATRPRHVLNRIAQFIHAFASSSVTGTIDVQDGNTTTAVAATGTLTLSSGTGTVGGTIGGTSVTVTWATSDTASATALATAINANTTVNKWVVATSVAGVVTLTATAANALGNNVTLVASGTGVTAGGLVGGKLSGGVNPTATTLTW